VEGSASLITIGFLRLFTGSTPRPSAPLPPPPAISPPSPQSVQPSPPPTIPTPPVDDLPPDAPTQTIVPIEDGAVVVIERPTAAMIIWRRKFWILLFAIIVGAGSTYLARLPSPSYGTSAILEVTMQQTSGSPNDTLLAANELAAQYAQLANTTAVLKAAATAINVPPGDLSHAISANTVSQLNLIRVTASGSTPLEAETRANATANALTRTILKANQRKANAFVRRATLPLAPITRQIAALKAQIAQSSNDLASATTDSQRAQAQTVLLGQQSTLTALTAQRSGAISGLAQDAALGQPAVSVVSYAGPGSRSRLTPPVYGAIGALAAAIVVGQLFVLADSRRRYRRIVRPERPGQG
jgi:capsular polysaccharide biosynthesis protein